jgi:hypothetical protein
MNDRPAAGAHADVSAVAAAEADAAGACACSGCKKRTEAVTIASATNIGFIG